MHTTQRSSAITSFTKTRPLLQLQLYVVFRNSRAINYTTDSKCGVRTHRRS